MYNTCMYVHVHVCVYVSTIVTCLSLDIQDDYLVHIILKKCVLVQYLTNV